VHHFTGEWKNMDFSRYRIILTIRILMLVISAILLAFTITHVNYLMVSGLIAVIIIYQTYALFHFSDKTNRELVRFFQAIENADFTQSSSIQNLGASFRELAKSFARVTERFIKLRAEKEEHFLYLQTVVQHVGVAVISYKANGDVELMNNAAKKLFNIYQLKNISSLTKVSDKLVETLFNINMGENALIRINGKTRPMHLSINATGFRLHGETFKLVSLQNIQNEIERERIGKELEIARNVQQALLPRAKPSITGFDINARCIPAREVGGDYYDFIQHYDNKVGIVIGDVSGKGVPAAIYMTLTKGIVQANVGENISPSEILVNVNNFMYKTMERGAFVTLVYAILNSKTRQIQFARAGHLPIIHFQNEQNRCHLLTPAGIGVGLESGTVFNRNLSTQTVDLKKGDWFIFYTDGFTESMNADQEEFGEQRLIDCIIENQQHKAQSMNENILQGIKDFSGKAIQHDDMTIVSIKVLT
jgi:serine phosphatase RsbU (regulator of sigma subunit)